LAAYLFSYQVHEKQILIPIMPIALLAHSLPTTALWASLTASFSLFPLLDREGLQIAYVALILAHVTVADSVLNLSLPSVAERIYAWSALLIAACLHLGKFLGYSVPSKPDLYVVLMTAFSCANFCLLYFVLLYHTYKSVSSPGAISTAKMHES
jgi:hypothetical protein